ncbi:hypothetical protein [uncultured Azohydromonas sp.]|jgi:hypothetical protein|uniref:hypothetical protein n=1 Tax=uncultured Azohydromonas sp. TaxID=487342 RepID=UPI0026100FA2|nr:hypothetical protein [uncultured Azohydromonas sp.]
MTVEIYRKFTVVFITPDGATNSLRIELTSNCSALAKDKTLDALLAEALNRWESAAGVRIIDMPQQASAEQATLPEAVE